MSVGIDGCLGKPMIREGQGLDIFVRRSLRDVFRKVPTFSLEVKASPIPNPNVQVFSCISFPILGQIYHLYVAALKFMR